jgi:outer membrane biosynthesis protein TonB
VTDEPLEGVSKLWDKISETVVKGLKSGKEELLRTSKMGRIRLEISSIKSRIEGKQKELGAEVYRLWLAKKVGIAELEGVFAEIKRLEEQIEEKEKEIEKLVEEREKEAAPLAEVKPLRPMPQTEEIPPAKEAEKSSPKRKAAKKSSSKKTKAEKPTSIPSSDTDQAETPSEMQGDTNSG